MESNLAKQVLEKQVLENGMKIYEIPIEKRTEKICINAMKWALDSQNINRTAEEKQEIMFGIMNCFPKELLLFSFVRTHLLK